MPSASPARAAGPPSTPGFGAAVRARRTIGLAVLVGLLAACAAASLLIGARALPPGEVWRVLGTPDGGEASAVVWSLRLPRTAIGIAVGAALGTAGVLMQSHTRNPIADPGVLGVAHGAALGVVLGVFLLGLTEVSAFVWLAVAGALAASAAVFAIAAGGSRGPTPVTLVLAGAAMSALLGGLVSAIVLMDHASLEVYRFWRLGTLAGRPLDVLWQVLPFIAAGLALAAANAPGLNALALGDDVATALGQRVRLTRATGVAAIALLTGAATAAAGPIAFVGLAAPHLARAVAGPDHRWMLPLAAPAGACLVLAADIAGRVVRGSGEVEVGIVLAVLGAPFFIALVRRGRMIAP
ncbi:FecCD family ABC transporter permease [Nocardiopsis suaedae]|uniref:Iron ABC transporter permease n=1 Tax=Nocardiopsis suaedae TaxID=3018444 RepID=A0ABT4TEI2_9ACTN|nr:iron ABC transporter permease [Nocardiopsis suaedae]MDA2803036.1 iron ABC transporter permease [Nocardiopsis suaedae]